MRNLWRECILFLNRYRKRERWSYIAGEKGSLVENCWFYNNTTNEDCGTFGITVTPSPPGKA